VSSEFATAQQHGERLAVALDADVGDLLREDPIEAVPLVFGIPVVVSDRASAGSSCSVAGSYTSEPTPEIRVGQFASRGRTLFTTLHELGHHLVREDDEVQDWCWATRHDDAEDLVVNAFAAAVLMPSALVDEHITARGPTARAVASLFGAATASREACCVRAAQRLTGAGAVVLAAGSTIQFAACRALPYRIGRDLEQDAGGFFDTAGRSVSTHRDDHVRVRFRRGHLSDPLFGDAVVDGDYTFAVLAEHRPAWLDFSVRTSHEARDVDDVDCQYCDFVFENVWRQPCRRCGARPCPRCDRCACEAPERTERRCAVCNIVLPRATPVDVTVCELHE
jgi:hypothetical protein